MTNRPIAVLVAGLSGAGKSTALRALGDAGFRVFDALPLAALAESVRGILAEAPSAFVVDHRSGDAVAAADTIARIAGESGVPVRRIFLESSDATLVRRYAETRRPHPYAATHPDLAEAIAAERVALAPLAAAADAVIATDTLEPRALAAATLALADGRPAGLRPTLLLSSFGFKHGAPADAEWLLDARSLPNPHWEPELRPRDGRQADVAAYALANPRGEAYLAALLPLVRTLLDHAAADGRASLSIAIGCTGGFHRSVSLVEALAAVALRDGIAGSVRIHHRDIARH
jgi:UPF0042 nucleotide-binding protein